MKKIKFLTSLFLSVSFLFLNSKSASAALITITPDHKLVFKNVLSANDDQSQLNVTKAGNISEPLSDAHISLTKEGGRITLNVQSSAGSSTSDVSDFKDKIVEIEETQNAKRVQIGIINNQFSISQSGFTVLTNFPIDINSQDSRLSVVSSSGVRYLGILPYEAMTYVLRSNIINRTDSGLKSFLLTENSQGELQYIIDGVRNINLFNIYPLAVPVTASLSATSGNLLSIDAPVWYKVFGFMFT